MFESVLIVTNTLFQCVLASVKCDWREDCPQGEDEMECEGATLTHVSLDQFPPGLVDLDENGFLTTYAYTKPWPNGQVQCPETHVECPGNNFCIPVYLRCNGVYDCPEHEDETGCDRHRCPGFYRCRGSTACLHPAHLCDGWAQCPQHDDELLCNLTCPDSCTCYGHAFFCTQPFQASNYTELRFLEAPASGVVPADVTNNVMLVHLGLAECSLTSLELPRLPNLHSLDLRDNLLQHLTLHHIQHVNNLRSLSLAGNPLMSFLDSDSVLILFVNIRVLDLSHVAIETVHLPELSELATKTLNISRLSFPPNLQTLNLSDSGVQRVLGAGFRPLKMLQTLDLRGCPVSEFPPDLLQGLTELRVIHTDNYKLCCPAILPKGFNVISCHAPSDEISSCESLLRSNIYRVFLFLFAILALIGNVGSLASRHFQSKKKKTIGFDVFVTSLCISDLLMGVYLAVIGVVDQLYQGDYMWKDTEWKSSAACQFAGFLSLLSSEVSALIICLITADRFLVLRFPLSQLRFSARSALLACCVVWTVGLALAAIPLLPVTSHWRFYSQTGICVPLPITRNDFPGHDYSFGILIVTNFVLFLLIAAGQVIIFTSIQANRLHVNENTTRVKDLTIARRLITIAVSDFLCWFPIGLLGLLAAGGVSVPGEVNVAMAIFALPVNSAINPFLYTLNRALERRKQKQYELLKTLLLQNASSSKARV